MARLFISTSTTSGADARSIGGARLRRVETDLEPGNRVTLSYHTNDPEDRVEIQAIVRRRNGFYYVFDTRLVDLLDSSRNFC